MVGRVASGRGSWVDPEGENGVEVKGQTNKGGVAYGSAMFENLKWGRVRRGWGECQKGGVKII